MHRTLNMADFEDENLSAEEKLSQRHRKERKELQAHTQKLKHAVPKGDKKRKKDVMTQIAVLEAELDQKQEEEMATLLKETNVNGVAEAVEQVTLTDENNAENVLEKISATGDATEQTGARKKQSKAQRRREKKAEKAAVREEEIQQAEVDNLSGARHLESQAIKKLLCDRGLALYEIPSDGDCLYAALVHQLKSHNVVTSTASLRQQTANHMGQNVDDFMPFLCNQSTGDPYTPSEFEAYCTKMESTPEWGGQLEIRALSNVLQHPVEVIQAVGPSIMTGEEHHKPTLTLSYHRHMYKLGEHFNSVIPKLVEEDGFS